MVLEIKKLANKYINKTNTTIQVVYVQMVLEIKKLTNKQDQLSNFSATTVLLIEF